MLVSLGLTGLNTIMLSASVVVPVVQKLDSAIHWINPYQLDSTILVSLISIHWIVIYPLGRAIQLLNNWDQNCTRTDGCLPQMISFLLEKVDCLMNYNKISLSSCPKISKRLFKNDLKQETFPVLSPSGF